MQMRQVLRKICKSKCITQFVFLEFLFYVQAFVRGMAIYLGLWFQLVVLTK
jgi:hypothetical protein